MSVSKECFSDPNPNPNPNPNPIHGDLDDRILQPYASSSSSAVVDLAQQDFQASSSAIATTTLATPAKQSHGLAANGVQQGVQQGGGGGEDYTRGRSRTRSSDSDGRGPSANSGDIIISSNNVNNINRVSQTPIRSDIASSGSSVSSSSIGEGRLNNEVVPGETDTPDSDVTDEAKGRQEIVNHIFRMYAQEDVGDVLRDYSCAIQAHILLHGRMYVTQKFICFYSNVFGQEKKVRIPFSFITKIDRENTLSVIPNAISVTTNKKVYLWRSFWDREDCFNLIEQQLIRVRSRISSKRKPNSIAFAPSTPVAIKELSSSSSSSSSSSHIVTSSSTPGYKEGDLVGKQEKASNGVSVSISSGGSSNTEDDHHMEHESGSKDLHDDSPSPNEAHSLLDLQKWHKEHAIKAKLAVPLIKDTLSCTFKEYVACFIADDAPYPLKRFFETQGYWDVNESKWEECSRGQGVKQMQKEMKFMKPIPQIASKTRGLKVFRYSNYGDKAGVVVEGFTTVEDVTAADCFRVEDSIIATVLSDNLMQVECYMVVNFIKSTWFKTIIDSTTTSEMRAFTEAYLKWAKANLQLYLKSNSSNSNSNSNSNSSNSSNSSSLNRPASVSVSSDQEQNSTSDPNTQQRQKQQQQAGIAISGPGTSSDINSNINSNNSNYPTIGRDSGGGGGGVVNQLLEPNKSKVSNLLEMLRSLASMIYRMLARVDDFFERCGFGGGRVFWCAWILLLIVVKSMSGHYLLMRYSFDEMAARLQALERANAEMDGKITSILKILEHLTASNGGGSQSQHCSSSDVSTAAASSSS